MLHIVHDNSFPPAKIDLLFGGSFASVKENEVGSGGGSNLKVGGAHGERGARAYKGAYKGVWGRSPQRGPGAEPLVRGSEG